MALRNDDPIDSDFVKGAKNTTGKASREEKQPLVTKSCYFPLPLFKAIELQRGGIYDFNTTVKMLCMEALAARGVTVASS